MNAPLVPVPIDRLRSVPFAFPYQGSKRVLAHMIVRLVPPGTGTLVDPFAGSAAVSLAVRYLGLAGRVVLSDTNGPLMGLWRQALDDPGAVADAYETEWWAGSRDPAGHYLSVRDRFNAGREPALLLYLLARCTKASVRYNRRGEFNQGAERRRVGCRPETMRVRLARSSAVLAGAAVAVGDWTEACEAAGPADLVYLDPPYLGVSEGPTGRYVDGLPFDGLTAGLKRAVGAGTSFVLSYDGSTGGRVHGRPLPSSLGLLPFLLDAGRSCQATLRGSDARTVEALYVSPALVDRFGGPARTTARLFDKQYTGS